MGRMLKEDFQTLRGFVVVLGGILVMNPLGTHYSYGNMVPYIVSYVRYRGDDPHITYQTASLILAAAILGQGLAMGVGGYLEKKLGVRLATFIGCVVFNIAVFASAWAVKVSFYFLLFTYGFLFGIGIGLTYLPPLVCVMKWMPQRKGVVNGLLLAGFGAGPLVFNIVQTLFINPHNLEPDINTNEMGAEQWYYSQKVVLDRVPFAFIQQGIIFSVVQIIGIMLLGDPPTLVKRSRRYAIRRKEKKITEKSGIIMNERPLSSTGNDVNGSAIAEGATGSINDEQPATGAQRVDPWANEAGRSIPETTDKDTSLPINTASTPTSSSSAESMGDRDPRWSGRTLSTLEMFKDPFFWQLTVAMFMDSFVILYLTTLYKVFGQTFIHDDLFLAATGACASVFNALSRIFWGHIADRFSCKVSFMTTSAIMAALTFTFGLSFYGNKVMFFIWVVGIFFSIGGVFSTAPTATSRAFGSDFVGVNYGFIFLFGVSIPSIVAACTQQLVLHFLPWDILFIVVGIFPVVGMITAMFFNLKTPNGVDI
ncbi:uncharacterized protein LOC100890289 isoform X2 [Strongylocentrotus purpuratus]|uniref:Major facilitator superfamily (MFS) profile domain-containing protein n=1 Tax=Strongylocentrotus purpuratus TaxID=7668 RepID=A0A7M7LP18_STRPU|nr:uncharacterized protein LOC100890289 isoform X2 [Strongylocentrotus purpuratus]